MKNLIGAWNEAEKQAREYEKRLNDIIRTSRACNPKLNATPKSRAAATASAVAELTRIGGITSGSNYENFEANLKRIAYAEKQIREGRKADAQRLREIKALNPASPAASKR